MTSVDPTRRRWLQTLALAGVFPAWGLARAATEPPWTLALAWSEPGASATAERIACVGVWRQVDDRFEVLARRVVPTRPHGLASLPTGDLLAVARRPGLWLQRWSRAGELTGEAWAEPGRHFNGHVLPSPDGRLIYSTEQTHDDGAGCVALRDARSLALLDEWPTGGTDTHQMLRVGDRLFVANGGVPTRPETGRAKQNLAAMDSSLVVFDLRTGQRRGPWRLPDARLSLRHLAWHAPSATLGIALQAEHDDPAQRARAPLLALFDGDRLQLVEPPAEQAALGGGYAGDIAATGQGFVLSASRAGALWGWSRQEGWTTPIPLAEACALVTASAAGAEGAVSTLGQVNAACALGSDRAWLGRPIALPAGCKPDNHAIVI